MAPVEPISLRPNTSLSKQHIFTERHREKVFSLPFPFSISYAAPSLCSFALALPVLSPPVVVPGQKGARRWWPVRAIFPTAPPAPGRLGATLLVLARLPTRHVPPLPPAYTHCSATLLFLRTVAQSEYSLRGTKRTVRPLCTLVLRRVEAFLRLKVRLVVTIIQSFGGSNIKLCSMLKGRCVRSNNH
jgi:hypothetical protein